MKSAYLALIVLLATAAFAAATPRYFWSKEVYSDDPFTSIAPEFAANGNGEILYRQSRLIGTIPSPTWSVRSSSGILLTVRGLSFGDVVGPPSLNNRGDVSFQAIDAGTGHVSAFRGERNGGTVLLTLIGRVMDGASGAPSMNSDGDVVFQSLDSSGSPEVRYAYRSPPLTGTIPPLDPGSLSRFGRPAINTARDIAVGVHLANGDDGVVVHRSGGTLLTVTGSNFRLGSSQPKIIDNKKGLLVNFNAQAPTGTHHTLFVAQYDSAISDFGMSRVAEVDSDCNAYMNENFSIACVDNDALKIFIASSAGNRGPESMTWSQETLIRVGDDFDGSTITSLALGDGSVLADDSVMFHATLANGATGIYNIVVPEPASAALAVLLLPRRRRR